MRSGRADFAVPAGFWWPFAVLLAFAGAAVWARGFTVDDALISVRYARNVAWGHGWAFNPGERPSDGVTPLPWPVVLVPFARLWGGFALLAAAKWIGFVATAVAVVLTARKAGPAALLLPFPLVAWAVSGMETGVATLCVTLAVTTRSPLPWAGLAAAFRPELLPWALVLAALRVRQARALLVLVPLGLCVLLRLAAFGRPVPLALLAKPSDLAHGAVYLLGAALACGTPLCLLGAWRKPAVPVAVAACVHFAVVALVGGDWMPYARLLVPVLPTLVLVPEWSSWRTRAAAALAVLAGLGVGWRAAPAGIGVGADRERLAAALRGLPTPVAALDVGFVAVAAGDGVVVDLGGLTDLEIAALPGGQTSKRVDLSMLEARGARAVVTWGEAGSRVVEQRVVQDARFSEHFVGRAVGELGGRAVWLWVRKN